MSRTLTKEEKIKIANRINYFRTMPFSIRKMAGNLEIAGRTTGSAHVYHEARATISNGRVAIPSFV